LTRTRGSLRRRPQGVRGPPPHRGAAPQVRKILLSARSLIPEHGGHRMTDFKPPCLRRSAAKADPWQWPSSVVEGVRQRDDSDMEAIWKRLVRGWSGSHHAWERRAASRRGRYTNRQSTIRSAAVPAIGLAFVPPLSRRATCRRWFLALDHCGARRRIIQHPLLGGESGVEPEEVAGQQPPDHGPLPPPLGAISPVRAG
jgi:hypothetical protein